MNRILEIVLDHLYHGDQIERIEHLSQINAPYGIRIVIRQNHTPTEYKIGAKSREEYLDIFKEAADRLRLIHWSDQLQADSLPTHPTDG